MERCIDVDGNTWHNIVLTGKTDVKTLTVLIVLMQINVIDVEVIFLVSGTEATRGVFRSSDHIFIFGCGNVDYIK